MYMDNIVIKIHESELLGTCDMSGECSELSFQLQELEDMGIDAEATSIITEHRQKVCASLGRCSLYFGRQDQVD